MLQRRTWLTIAATTTLTVAMGTAGCKKGDSAEQAAEWRIGVIFREARVKSRSMPNETLTNRL